jgi:hypothetical protein
MTNYIYEIKLKPKSKNLTVSELSDEFRLVVLQVNHQWFFIS